MKYFIKTFGCQMNISDSERIAGFLDSQNLKEAKKIETADLVVLNTCGVRQMAEDRVYGIIHNLRTQNTKRISIVLTGCLANRPDVRKRMQDKVDLFCEIKDFQKKFSPFGKGRVREGFEKFPKSLEAPLNPPFPKREKCNYLSIAPKYSDKNSAYVPIMTGCNNFCAYCVVPYARGREASRPVEEIFSEIENLAKNKYQEIILLGQNVNSYNDMSTSPACLPRRQAGGRGVRGEGENKISFPVLLNNLAKTFPEITFRFLTSHPKDFSDELINAIAENKNIYREIHLPFQAGSNKILRAMNRPYTKKKYLDLIKKIKTKVPDASFTTDVIVGFPGETKKDFLDTVDIFKKVVYNEAYINKYSPRPGTAAWKLGDPILLEEKKRREKVLRRLVKPDTKYRKEKNNEKTGK